MRGEKTRGGASWPLGSPHITQRGSEQRRKPPGPGENTEVGKTPSRASCGAEGRIRLEEGRK